MKVYPYTRSEADSRNAISLNPFYALESVFQVTHIRSAAAVSRQIESIVPVALDVPQLRVDSESSLISARMLSGGTDNTNLVMI